VPGIDGEFRLAPRVDSPPSQLNSFLFVRRSLLVGPRAVGVSPTVVPSERYSRGWRSVFFFALFRLPRKTVGSPRAPVLPLSKRFGLWCTTLRGLSPETGSSPRRPIVVATTARSRPFSPPAPLPPSLVFQVPLPSPPARDECANP